MTRRTAIRLTALHRCTIRSSSIHCSTFLSRMSLNRTIGSRMID